MRYLALLALTAICACQPANGSTDPGQIARDIDSTGASAVVHKLYTDGTYESVLNHIASGEDDWVKLASRLAPGADAAASEGLVIAMAEALPRNPVAVLLGLDAAGQALSPQRICGVPFIEGTQIDIPAYIRQTEKAVSDIQLPRLQAIKAQCLAALRS